MSEQPKTPTSSEECIPSFIRKTYRILEDNTNSDVVSWNNEGNALVIKNPTEFAQSILPTYFKHNNINSFIRQLNMYDFHKKKTPDGEHVYYHELFQRGKKHLLKNIRRKNAENSTLNTEKSRLGLELVKTKQDIATIVNENIVLKKINNEALTTISSLEAKINEMNLQNQNLWSQVMKYSEKEELLKSIVPNLKREIPSYPLINIDTNRLANDSVMNKAPQTTTRIPNFSTDMPSTRSWSMVPGNFDTLSYPGYYSDIVNENTQPIIADDKMNRTLRNNMKTKIINDQPYTDLSQQIVKNMDQEIQYLKKLTSSNQRPANTLSAIESPDSSVLGKRRIETDPNQGFAQYDTLTKYYRPDAMYGLNFLNNPYQVEAEIGHTIHGM